jgi:hypothetical protein
MLDVTVSVDEEVYEVLKVLAELEKRTVEEVLRGMLLETLDEIKARMNDPLIGALDPYLPDDGSQTDIASRADDIIRDEWEPD